MSKSTCDNMASLHNRQHPTVPQSSTQSLTHAQDRSVLRPLKFCTAAAAAAADDDDDDDDGCFDGVTLRCCDSRVQRRIMHA